MKQWLADKEGLGQLKMTTQGFGARKPVAPNAKPDGSDDPREGKRTGESRSCSRNRRRPRRKATPVAVIVRD